MVVLSNRVMEYNAIWSKERGRYCVLGTWGEFLGRWEICFSGPSSSISGRRVAFDVHVQGRVRWSPQLMRLASKDSPQQI